MSNWKRFLLKTKRFIAGAVAACYLLPATCRAEIFTADEPVVAGLNVIEMSGVFADIYKKLDSVKWGGKDIRIALEAIENIAPKTKIAATDIRVVVLSGDTIIGNWPRPKAGDWNGYGQITTAMILKMREVSPALAKMDAPALYRAAVGALMKGINESGKYVYSEKEQADDPRVLTSLGIAGVRTGAGDYVLNTIFNGSPAEHAGLVIGDILISANGVMLRDLSDMEVLGLFNGFSSGTIKIRAVGFDGKEKSAVIRRASIIIADADIVAVGVHPESGGQILEVIVHKISDDSVSIVAGALESYRGKISGIYLDLRGTTGDDEIAMAKMAGLFLGRVPVARIAAPGDDELEIVPGGDAMTDVPVVAAVSNATSGAAEGLAFALYENGAVVIGMPTAGKGKLMTKIGLENGGSLELMSRTMRSGRNRTIDGRGFFPVVCLSNIRTSDQKDVFVVNVKNHEYAKRDFNKDESVDAETIRKGCPNIKSGSDEDAASKAVAMDILLNPAVYRQLAMNEGQ